MKDSKRSLTYILKQPFKAPYSYGTYVSLGLIALNYFMYKSTENIYYLYMVKNMIYVTLPLLIAFYVFVFKNSKQKEENNTNDKLVKDYKELKNKYEVLAKEYFNVSFGLKEPELTKEFAEKQGFNYKKILNKQDLKNDLEDDDINDFNDLASLKDKDVPNDGSFEIYKPSKKSVKMCDVAGCEEVKEELNEVIDFLKNPDKYYKMGAKIPKGVLFMGPPGTGKTLLARAVAGEAGVKYIYTSGSEFVERYVGVGAARMRSLFDEARKTNEPCIIFIDEIDAIGSQRNMGNNDSEKDKTLNQLLVEMDGFTKDSQVVVIAATNRADVLDSALLRPGRFDRQIMVGLPSQKERLQILKIHAKNKPVENDFDFESLSKKTTGFSGAQLGAVLNEAALLAVRNNQSKITLDLALESIDRVLMGPAKKGRAYVQKEKKLVAYHEAGHAVAGLMLDEGRKVEKITIIPRGNAGGYNLFSDKEETFFLTRKGILAEIITLLGGRAAEEIVFGEVTSGASNDLLKATELARRFVCEYGMSSLGLMQMYESVISEQTSVKIDEEINSIITNCYQDCKDLLAENRILLDDIASTLMKKETIDSAQIEQIAVKYI